MLMDPTFTKNTSQCWILDQQSLLLGHLNNHLMVGKQEISLPNALIRVLYRLTTYLLSVQVMLDCMIYSKRIFITIFYRISVHVSGRSRWMCQSLCCCLQGTKARLRVLGLWSTGTFDLLSMLQWGIKKHSVHFATSPKWPNCSSKSYLSLCG